MKTQGADGNYKPRREAWNRPSLAVPRRNCPCPQPWILASRPAQLGDDTSLSFAPPNLWRQRTHTGPNGVLIKCQWASNSHGRAPGMAAMGSPEGFSPTGARPVRLCLVEHGSQAQGASG